MLLLVAIWMDQAKVQEVGKGLHPLRISWNLTWCMCLASCWRRIGDFYNTATILVICESCRILVKQKNCLPPFQAASHFPPASKLWKSTMAFGSPACRLIPVPFFQWNFIIMVFDALPSLGMAAKTLMVFQDAWPRNAPQLFRSLWPTVGHVGTDPHSNHPNTCSQHEFWIARQHAVNWPGFEWWCSR